MPAVSGSQVGAHGVRALPVDRPWRVATRACNQRQMHWDSARDSAEILPSGVLSGTQRL